MTKTELIRDVIRYLRQFRGSTVVIHLDDALLDSPLFAGHMQDLGLLSEAGIRIVIVPGAKLCISRVLETYHVPWRFVQGMRITDGGGMDLIKMAAFDVSDRVMSRLAAERLHGVVGNWVSARGMGVVDGTDFGSAGKITRIDKASLERVIDDGFLPILPCVGWTAVGRAYNLSSVDLAVETARVLHASKLFFLEDGLVLRADELRAPESAVISQDNRIASIPLDDVEPFLADNGLAQVLDSGTAADGGREDVRYTAKNARTAFLLRKCREACLGGVTRAHILNGAEDGAVPGEIFSETGSGTMIFRSDYSRFRTMTAADVPAVLSLMHPFIQSGILLPRSEEEVKGQAPWFTVYEIDGGIRACAELKPYPGCNCAEIAAVAVDDSCANSGIGPALMRRLIAKARGDGRTFVFVLTTQTADWFERFGFRAAGPERLPEERVRRMDPARGSRILILPLDRDGGNPAPDSLTEKN